MSDRILAWLRSHSFPFQAMSVVMLCLLIGGAFVLGAMVSSGRVPDTPASANSPPKGEGLILPREGTGRRIGTFAAIERIEGDRIHLRDPRSGRRWAVRANPNTVVEFGPQRRIPWNALHPGQRVFVVGVPDTPAWNEGADGLEWDAQFIGVVLGQQQKFFLSPPVWCDDCMD